MIYTNIKSFPDRLALTVGKTINKLALVGLGILATACEWKSPPLELTDEAKFALKLELVQKQLDAQRAADLKAALAKKKELESIKPAPVPVAVSPEAQLFFEPESIPEQLAKTTTESLVEEYLQRETDQSKAILIMAELVNRKSYEFVLPLLMQRVTLTSKLSGTAVDINAYFQLTTTAFARVSVSSQLQILEFVKKTWRSEPFTAMAYTSLHNTMLRSAKAPELYVQIRALIQLMERSGHNLVLESQDKRYDSLDGGVRPEVAPGPLLAAGGGSRE